MLHRPIELALSARIEFATDAVVWHEIGWQVSYEAAHPTEALGGPEAAEEPLDTEIVPVATRLVDGLPPWAVDELFEAVGA